MFIGSREIDDERIRALLCEYSNAYLAAPIIEACRQAGLFETLSTRYWVSLPRLVRKHRANSGYLAVALRLLVSIGWLTRRADYHYRLTARAEPEAVANGILVLYEQAFDKILADPHAQALFSQYLQPLIFPVRDASMHSVTSGALTRSLRQAPVALPLLMALCDARGSSLDSKEIVLGRQLVEPLRSTLQSFLIEQGWASATGDANAACRLSRSGRLLFGQIDEMLLAVSYRPTLAQIETLLFGDARSMIRRDGEGEESHIDRSLDLRLIDLQVERYMEDIEWQIINVFNNADFARQPRYIADIGCGDARYPRRQTPRGLCGGTGISS